MPPEDDKKPIGQIRLLSLQELNDVYAKLVRRVGDLEASRELHREEWRRERNDIIDAVKRFVEPAVTDLSRRFEKFENNQEASLKILQESREWVKLGLEGKKIDVTVDADMVKIQADARVRRATVVWGLITTIVTTAGIIITALITSNARAH